MIIIKRIYEPFDKKDGYRILVDRLWPRNMSKDKARVDLWLKDIAPSTDLSKWFGHDPDKWREFRRRYLKELEEKRALLEQIEAKAQEGSVTLVYGAKDEVHNNAEVIMEYLKHSIAAIV